MNNNHKFWVVGATLDGSSATRCFLNRGYWQLGTRSKPKRDVLYMERFSKIAPGDRIAIKSCGGKGTALLRLKAIGIVKDVVPEERRVYVNWVLPDINREVDWNGCMDAISGPYMLDGKDKDWVNEIFRI